MNRVGAPPVEFTLNERGMPKADGCICFLDCDVVAAHDHGDHTIFVGRLREADTGEGQPLIFHDRHLRERIRPEFVAEAHSCDLAESAHASYPGVSVGEDTIADKLLHAFGLSGIERENPPPPSIHTVSAQSHPSLLREAVRPCQPFSLVDGRDVGMLYLAGLHQGHDVT